MQYLRVKLIAVLLLDICLTELQAQKVILSAGGEGSGSGGSASYSIGQIVYTTNTGTNGSVAQGVQQPYEISAIEGIKRAGGINLVYSAHPNPATDFIMLKIDGSTALDVKSMLYQLYNNNGKLLENKKLEGNETIIDMSNRVPAIYFLKITGNNKEVINFKIIKH